MLYLSSNQLSGPIPASLGNLPKLATLYLSSNQLSGPIPASLGNLPKLATLYLAGNQLSGCLPAAWRYIQHNERNDLAQLGLPFCDAP